MQTARALLPGRALLRQQYRAHVQARVSGSVLCLRPDISAAARTRQTKRIVQQAAVCWGAGVRVMPRRLA